MPKSKLFPSLLLWVLFALCANHVAAQTPDLVTEDLLIASGDSGIRLFVRNKRPSVKTDFSAAETLLFVHGATYPASGTFDLKLDDLSWMEYIAQRGFDVYLVDLRGYGRSDRPREMSDPPEAHPPLVKTEQAIRDFGVAVDHIRQRRGIDKLNVMGWSWGTTIVGGFTARHPEKVNKLVLVAPVWVPRETVDDAFGEIPAWRAVTRQDAWGRWVRGVPEEKVAEVIPEEWFDAWWNLNMQIAPVGAAMDPPVIIAPNGTLYDIEKWLGGSALYDPSRIVCPVLSVVGEWDSDTPRTMAMDLFDELRNASTKRMLLIGESTHSLMLEKNRLLLFRAVQGFLED